MGLIWLLLRASLVTCFLPIYSGLLKSLSSNNKRYESSIDMVDCCARDAVRSASEKHPTRVYKALGYARSLMFTPVKIMLKVCAEELKDETAKQNCRDIAASMDTDSHVSFLELELRRIQVEMPGLGRSTYHVLLHMQKCRKTHHMITTSFKDVSGNGLMRILGYQRVMLFYQHYYDFISGGGVVMSAVAMGIGKLILAQRIYASIQFARIVPQLMPVLKDGSDSFSKAIKKSGLAINKTPHFQLYKELQLNVDFAAHITEIMYECALKKHNHELCLKMEDQLEHTILNLQRVLHNCLQKHQAKNI